ncbi:cupin domain-containing protein [Deinococcus hopiensis]|uniref:Cupin domain protein n=1 Tax=Deinococcus hopiensis KR-140 TaxID=695939 RepID=A0A1W1UR60_9DEIO|nr:cupin domain-containing protein [Deinococcus hopiensis]SMB83184.1 Cupin domain protein [Deinococcus hopiensis KR-140]
MYSRKVSDLTTAPGPAALFTGQVWVDALTPDAPDIETKILRVTFTPGARTAWHIHPHEQILVVTLGRGLLRRKGETPQVMNQGDTFIVQAGEEHWHGAAPDSLMQHLAVQPAAASQATQWLAHVADGDDHLLPR